MNSQQAKMTKSLERGLDRFVPVSRGALAKLWKAFEGD